MKVGKITRYRSSPLLRALDKVHEDRPKHDWIDQIEKKPKGKRC